MVTRILSAKLTRVTSVWIPLTVPEACRLWAGKRSCLGFCLPTACVAIVVSTSGQDSLAAFVLILPEKRGS